jgi:hypothetical protein
MAKRLEIPARLVVAIVGAIGLSGCPSTTMYSTECHYLPDDGGRPDLALTDAYDFDGGVCVIRSYQGGGCEPLG